MQICCVVPAWRQLDCKSRLTKTPDSSPGCRIKCLAACSSDELDFDLDSCSESDLTGGVAVSCGFQSAGLIPVFRDGGSYRSVLRRYKRRNDGTY